MIDLDAPEQRVIKEIELSIYDGTISAQGLFFRENGLLVGTRNPMLTEIPVSTY